MHKHVIATDKAPAAIGPYSQAVRAGNLLFTAGQIPLDPAGRTAAVRVHTTMYGAAFAGLLTAFGADTPTEAVGEIEMISRDTAKYGFVSYLQKQGNPPTLCAIMVMTGTLKFSSNPTLYPVSFR